MRTAAIFAVLGLACLRAEDIALPAQAHELLERYCWDCHDESEQKGEINLEAYSIDWDSRESLELWARVMRQLEKGEMPPEEKKQPSGGERARLEAWLDGMLSTYDPVGGSGMRRLNRSEYARSLEQLFGVRFKLPDGFPKDGVSHGFDNQAEALALSGSLFENYSEIASGFAEKLFPPVRETVEPEVTVLAAKDFTYAYSSGFLTEGVMRLVSSTDAFAHSASWPTYFQSKTTGIYRLALDLSAFEALSGEAMKAEVYAVLANDAPSSRASEARVLGRYEVKDGESQRFEDEILLEKGETIVVRYASAPLSEEVEKLKPFVRSLLTREPELAAAFKKAGGKVARARVGLDHLYSLIDDGDLPEAPVGDELEELVDLISKDKRSLAETLHYRTFEEGPALEVVGVRLEGPIEMRESENEIYWRERAEALFEGVDVEGEGAFVEAFLRRFLASAFRRPATNEQILEYRDLVLAEKEREGRLEDGYNLAIRTALTSPHFLYRNFSDGGMDGYDLAARLSYFLTMSPPDSGLFSAAGKGDLEESAPLRRQAEKLLESKAFDRFVESFLDQWLDLEALETLVPDATLFKKPREFKYSEAEKVAFRLEALIFFKEMIRENRPVSDFIDPDFTYTTGVVARHIYGLPEFAKAAKSDNKKMRRISIERGGRVGGVLGMAGVMTATANGVDTQPVMRGVWVLENIMGDAPPPPPEAVPALTPDTSKAESPKEMLAAHMGEESCAGCHKKIDPIGFVLESFDPVGRWRESYPVPRTSKKGKSNEGIPVDTYGELPDGTLLRDVTDLKAYLCENITPFAECLSEQLLTYATGRAMGYGDRKVIAGIVEQNLVSGGGFRGLLLSLIDSESFRAK